MTYQVKNNTDLWLIAAWFYGNPHLWEVIYYENIDLIGDDPENLSPGMTLNIPAIETRSRSVFVPVPEAI